VKTVLILEDNSSILALMHHVVEQDGYAVLDATSAEEAFRRFEESNARVDLLVTDVVLPASSGIRVALELRSLLPNLRAVILSGYPVSAWPERDAAEINELPSNSIVMVQKPFRSATLLNAIHRFIGFCDELKQGPQFKAATTSET
jgi:CheY-like chemotaxis protein